MLGDVLGGSSLVILYHIGTVEQLGGHVISHRCLGPGPQESVVIGQDPGLSIRIV